MTNRLQKTIRIQLLALAEERDLPITVADVAALANAVHSAVLDTLHPESPVTLTGQQVSVLTGLARGDAPADTARRMCISSNTVRTHRQAAYKRLGARTAGQAVALAMSYGLIRPAAPHSLPSQRNERSA